MQGGVIAWLCGRVAGTAAVLLVVSAVLFAMTHATPVSPARIVLGGDATAEQIASFEREHGLDRPVAVQYGQWVSDLPTAGFGRSVITNLSINAELAATLPVTLKLVGFALLLTVAGSLLFGCLGAFWEDTVLDHVLRVLSVAFLSVPGFWLGLLLIRVFAVRLGWFPPGGAGVPGDALSQFRALVLPAGSIAAYYIGALSRLLRAGVVDVLGQDYTRTGVALGLRRRTVWAYTLRNALPPFVGVAAQSFGYMFGWAMVVELVFNIPGLSRSLLNAITQRDYPTIQAAVMVITAVFVLSGLVSELLPRWLDPRLAATA